MNPEPNLQPLNWYGKLLLTHQWIMIQINCVSKDHLTSYLASPISQEKNAKLSSQYHKNMRTV
jgi:hypothetical protein